MAKSHFPLLGIALFCLLYGCAAARYPGGNQADALAPGFDWANNYWCDLLGPRADNGQPNPARPVAMFATAILAAALAAFWWRLSGFLAWPRGWRRLVRASGVISMASALIIFSDFHDTAILVSGISGLLAVGATVVFLWERNLRGPLRFGAFCLGLVAANNAVYWSKIGLGQLPVLQKITFAAFLFWVAWVSLYLKKSR